jgi:hypothetical protein
LVRRRLWKVQYSPSHERELPLLLLLHSPLLQRCTDGGAAAACHRELIHRVQVLHAEQRQSGGER